MKSNYQIQKCDRGGDFFVMANFRTTELDAMTKAVKYRSQFKESSFRVMERTENGDTLMVCFIGDTDAGYSKGDDDVE